MKYEIQTFNHSSKAFNTQSKPNIKYGNFRKKKKHFLISKNKTNFQYIKFLVG